MVIHSVCLFGNKWQPLHLELNIMEAKTIKVILSEETESFVRLQPVKAQQKITYNIRKLESGVMDNNLFKKLGNSEIWELRTLFSGVCAFRFLGYRNGNTCCCYTRNHKENTENSAKRNTTGRRNKKRIF